MRSADFILMAFQNGERRALTKMRLHCVEGRLIDDRPHRDGDDLADRLQRLGL